MWPHGRRGTRVPTLPREAGCPTGSGPSTSAASRIPDDHVRHPVRHSRSSTGDRAQGAWPARARGAARPPARRGDRCAWSPASDDRARPCPVLSLGDAAPGARPGPSDHQGQPTLAARPSGRGPPCASAPATHPRPKLVGRRRAGGHPRRCLRRDSGGAPGPCANRLRRRRDRRRLLVRCYPRGCRRRPRSCRRAGLADQGGRGRGAGPALPTGSAHAHDGPLVRLGPWPGTGAPGAGLA